jgi:hypothetical protein
MACCGSGKRRGHAAQRTYKHSTKSSSRAGKRAARRAANKGRRRR